MTFILKYFPAEPGGEERVIPIDADTFNSDERGVHFYRRGVHIGSLDSSELIHLEHVE